MRQVGSKAIFTFISKNGLNKPFYYFFLKKHSQKTMKDYISFTESIMLFHNEAIICASSKPKISLCGVF